MQSANRVLKNTGFLYGKMVFTIFISLYSTRLILNALGAVDYGIFTLVAGVISMLSFINGAMIIATQRYLSISLGAGDKEKTKAVFSASVVLHLIIGLVIVVALEIGGIFLFNGSLNIPAERIGTAKIIYHFMVISTFFTINAVPYDASINSHENMLFDAISGIFEATMKLFIAIILVYYAKDKLILYGILTAALTILIRVIKSFYCYRKYEECRVKVKHHINTALLKEMVGFAGWNLFGLFCSVLKNQGLAIMLNLFFGIVVNAAYGIANQVNANIRAFSSNMLKALMPQITKSEGSGDRKRMLRLSIFACKTSFFLLAFFSIPIIIEMPFVLKIWLKTVPENAVSFCQLILLLTMMYQITIGTMAAVTSVGKIKTFQIAVGALEIFNLPLAYVLVKIGLPAYSVFVGSLFMELVASGIRIWFAHKIADLDIKDFVVNTWLRSVFAAAVMALAAFLVRYILHEGFIRAFLVGVTSTLIMFLLVRYFVLSEFEIGKVREIIISVYNKIRKRNLPAGAN
jgi:O-antigen/teichoic acid export membrane protein